MRHITRRMFAGALAAAGVLPAEKKMRILILGGTGFLGPATVEVARRRGHQLTLFNRGKTRPDLFTDIEQLHGDRDPNKGGGIQALAGRKWDAVIDNSAYYPRHVSASAKLLAPSVKQYILISTLSVYADNSRENQDESAKLATLADPAVEEMGKEYENYGGLKALCEKAAEAAMPGRVTVVRPGYIVGPDDPSGRFTYRPVRIDKGGEVAAPGAPTDPVQFIDVRDLGAWLILLAERGATGAFNALGPEKRLAWGDVLQACQQATPNRSNLVWIPAEFVQKQKVAFPIWEPYTGETAGFHTWSNARALKAGLRFRPYQETVRDTLAWFKTQGEGGRTRLAGPKPEQEAELIAAWRKRA